MSSEENNWVAEAHARQQRQLLMIGGGIAVLLVAAGAAFWLWPTAARDLAAAEPAIEGRRAQYCAIWEQVDALSPDTDDLSGTGERVVLPGYVWLDAGDISHPTPGANADEIEASTLAALCGDEEGADRPSARLFTGVLEDLAVDPDSPRVDEYDREGVALAVSMLDRFECLVVFDVGHRTDSTVSRDQALSPGSLAGTLHVFRLEDAHRIGSMPVAIEAPSSAYVYVSRNAYGGTNERELDTAVNAEASGFFRDVIADRAADRGLTLVVRDES